MKRSVPFIDLNRLLERFNSGAKAAFDSSISGCELVGGPGIAEFETKLSSVCQAPFAVACANGTDALILALQASGIGPGSKVALPNLTFWATYEAIVQLGAEPILVDCCSEDLQLSLGELKKAHHEFSLDAVLTAHLFGWASKDLAGLRDFCKEEKLILLEDSAQAYGAKIQGESIFSRASVSTLSFYPAKVIGGLHDGGALLCQNEQMAKKIRSLANHGRSEHYSYQYVGWNSRMGGMQARWLLFLLDQSDEILQDRKKAFDFYRGQLADLDGVTFVDQPDGQLGNGYLCVLRVNSSKRDSIVKKLKRNGISVGVTYPETMDMQPPAKDSKRVGDLAESRKFVKEVINLPLFYGITQQELELVCDEFKKSLT